MITSMLCILVVLQMPPTWNSLDPCLKVKSLKFYLTLLLNAFDPGFEAIESNSRMIYCYNATVLRIASNFLEFLWDF